MVYITLAMTALLPSTQLKVEDWVWEKEKDPPFHSTNVNSVLIRHTGALFPDGKKGRVFVPLCGKSVDMLYLADLGHEVTGLEFSEIGVEAFFEENKLNFTKESLPEAAFVVYKATERNITIYRGDLFDFNVGICGKFDAIWDRGSYVAVNVDQRTAYTDLIFTLMRPDAKLLLETFSYDGSKYAGPPHRVTEDHMKETFGRLFNFQLLDILEVAAGVKIPCPEANYMNHNYLVTMKNGH